MIRIHSAERIKLNSCPVRFVWLSAKPVYCQQCVPVGNKTDASPAVLEV